MKIFGGPQLATPTCQVLPPNFPGYEPYCPYTKNPGSGKWTAPDMQKAQQLVNESGTKGMTVKVNTTNIDPPKSYGLYFVGLLNKLGYKASLQPLSSSIQYPYVQNSKNKVQMAYSDWFQDYPAASDFLDILLGCGSFHPNSNSSPNIAAFCNKSIQSKMDQAGQTGITDPNRRQQAVGSGRQGGNRPGAVGGDDEPEVRQLRGKAGQGIHLQPAVVLPARPGIREVVGR